MATARRWRRPERFYDLLARLLVWLLADLRVVGAERIPAHGGVLLAANLSMPGTPGVGPGADRGRLLSRPGGGGYPPDQAICFHSLDLHRDLRGRSLPRGCHKPNSLAGTVTRAISLTAPQAREALRRPKVMAAFARGTQRGETANSTARPPAPGAGPTRAKAGMLGKAGRPREDGQVVLTYGHRDRGILGAGDAASRVVVWDADVRQ